MQQIEGAFAAVVLSENAVAGFRDPDGIRPLVVGRVDDAWVLASETCALDIIGATVERELAPGELVVLDERGAHFSQAVPPRSESLCIFEYIYFARPDTTLNGRGLYEARVEMGRRLAAESAGRGRRRHPGARLGHAGRRRLRPGAAASRSARGWSRTATSAARSSSPTRALRERGVKLKFNVLRSVLEGKRVVVVDDSIVRGSTTRKLVTMLFEAGAAEVHLRISSPPIISPCFYGIDMADQDELIAAGRNVEQVRDALGATSLAYLSLDGLQEATGQGSDRFCRACLTGDLPDPHPRRDAALQAPVRAAAGEGGRWVSDDR